MEATLEAITFDELVGIQDMGAAGLTSSSSEMAAKGEWVTFEIRTSANT